jgi:hypothetical protein
VDQVRQPFAFVIGRNDDRKGGWMCGSDGQG